VVAAVAAPSVVGATLRSSFQLGRGTSNRMPSAAAAAAAAAAALYLQWLKLTPPNPRLLHRVALVLGSDKTPPDLREGLN
jgi:hypothetical protein